MIQTLELFHDDLESLVESENKKLNEMDSRKRALGDYDETVTRLTICIDSARTSLADAIEDLSKSIE